MAYWRHFRTQQERRRWFADEDLVSEYPQLKLRRSRAAHQLPTVYEDIPVDRDDRNWKNFRSHQWGVVRNSNKKRKNYRIIWDTPKVPLSTRWWFFINKLHWRDYRVRQAYRRWAKIEYEFEPA